MRLSGAGRDDSTSVKARCTDKILKTSKTNNKVEEEQTKDRKYFDRREKRLKITANNCKTNSTHQNTKKTLEVTTP